MKSELKDEKFIYNMEQRENIPKCYSKNEQTMKTNGRMTIVFSFKWLTSGLSLSGLLYGLKLHATTES